MTYYGAILMCASNGHFPIWPWERSHDWQTKLCHMVTWQC